MSQNRKITFYTFVNKFEPEKEIVVDLYYNLAKVNYATASSKNRGYYLSAQPIEKLKSESGFTMIRFGAYTGTHLFIKPATSYSESTLTHLAAHISKEKIARLVNWVIEHNKFSIADYDLSAIS